MATSRKTITAETIRTATETAVLSKDKTAITAAIVSGITFETETAEKTATAVLSTYASTGNAIDALARLARETASDVAVAAKECMPLLDALEINAGNASTVNLRLRAHRALTGSPETFRTVADSLVSDDENVRPWSTGIVTLVKAAEIARGIITGDDAVKKAAVSVAARAAKETADKAAKVDAAEKEKAAKVKAAKVDASTVIAGDITMGDLRALDTAALVALISASEAVIVAAKVKADAAAKKAAKKEKKAAKVATATATAAPTAGDDAFNAQVAKLVEKLGVSAEKAAALLS